MLEFDRLSYRSVVCYILSWPTIKILMVRSSAYDPFTFDADLDNGSHWKKN